MFYCVKESEYFSFDGFLKKNPGNFKNDVLKVIRVWIQNFLGLAYFMLNFDKNDIFSWDLHIDFLHFCLDSILNWGITSWDLNNLKY